MPSISSHIFPVGSGRTSPTTSGNRPLWLRSQCWPRRLPAEARRGSGIASGWLRRPSSRFRPLLLRFCSFRFGSLVALSLGRRPAFLFLLPLYLTSLFSPPPSYHPPTPPLTPTFSH